MSWVHGFWFIFLWVDNLIRMMVFWFLSLVETNALVIVGDVMLVMIMGVMVAIRWIKLGYRCIVVFYPEKTKNRGGFDWC